MAPRAPAAPPTILRLSFCPGRLRDWRHRALVPAVGIAGWLWFGAAGALPLLLWWWRRWPDPVTGDQLLDLGAVRRARLGRWRTCLVLHSGERLEIFHDELAPPALASLRRQLAAGLRTSRRSEKPGNRIVSSELGRVSG